MKSFLHDSSAFDDEKVYELYMSYGYKGVGIFYVILEKLAQQEKPIKESVLLNQLQLAKKDYEIVNFMAEINLIQRRNGEISNKNLMDYIETYVEKKTKDAIRKRKHRDNQQVTENVTRDSESRHTPNTNTNTNTNTKSNIDEEFDKFWDLYDKKVGRNLAYNQWINLSDKDKEEIFKAVPKYIASRESKYRRNPDRYLINRVWEDEIIYQGNLNKEVKAESPKPKQRKEIVVPEDF